MNVWASPYESVGVGDMNFQEHQDGQLESAGMGNRGERHCTRQFQVGEPAVPVPVPVGSLGNGARDS